MQDADVLEAVRASLLASGYFDLKSIRFSIEEKKVVLRGTVGSYFMKQKAQATIRDYVFDYGIENLLEVVTRNQEKFS
jgi:osmotically-inducible protein OsmY